jgi:pseudomonalisin
MRGSQHKRPNMRENHRDVEPGVSLNPFQTPFGRQIMTWPLRKLKSSLRPARLATTAALLAFASTLLASPVFAQSFNALPRNRVVGPIVDSDAVTVTGNVHPLARAEFDRGLVSDDTRLDRMVLLLAPDAEQQKDLDALTEAQQEPNSPYYHQWLTAAEYGSRFGASTGDIARITAWLTSRGFQVEEVPAGHRSIVFSGSAAQVADTFHTEIHSFAVHGQSHIANTQDPQVPRALAGVVTGILSLHDFRRTSAIQSKRLVSDAASPSAQGHANGIHAENTQGSSHYLFPADFATIYDLNPQYNAGKNGTGTSIAIVGRSNINLSDVSSFRSYTSLAANQPTVILVGSNPGLVSGDQDESTLDVEWSGATAPNATIKFVVAASTSTSDGVDLSAQYIVNHNTAPIMSTSYGSCEAYMGSSEMAFYNSLWQQAASEGISSFVSSGDSGAAGCNSGSSSSGSQAAVNGLCSSQYSTCVGGTEFNENAGGSGSYWSASNGNGGGSALSYIPEKVWNESGSAGGSGLWASGGGASTYYTQPGWQAGVSGASHNGMRLVPDVAVTAASHDGYLINENGSFYVIAGTSAASPSYAGIMALVVQNQGGTGQGNANPGLYGMLNATQNPYHATPSGNNTVPGVAGFTASGAAYNLATGLGSPDGNELVNGWAASNNGGGTTQTPGFTLRTSVSTEALLPAKSTTFTVSVTGTGGFTGSAALSVTGLPTGVTLAFNPATVKAGASSTATLAVTSSAVAGTYTITLKGTSGQLSATTTIALTVQSTPKLAITASSSHVVLVRGQSVTLNVTAVTSGSFTGTVSLTVTGMPTGVTATVSPASYSAAGSNSTTATLTLKATTAAALSSSTLTIKATGDGLTAQTTTSVQVMAAPAVTIAASSASINMQSMATQAFTATVVPAGGVSLASSAPSAVFHVTGLPAGITGSWSAATLTSAGSLQSQLTLTGGTSAQASSTHPIISVSVPDSVTGTAYTANETLTLTVTHVAATLTVKASTSKITVVQGQSGSVMITSTYGGSYAGAVKLGITGLPAGVTATWANASFTPGGAGSTTSVLTLNSALGTTVASSNFIITASGDGIAAQSGETVQVTPAPSIKVALSIPSVGMKSNASQAVVVTVTPIGSASLPAMAPASSFQVTGLPTGITATWGTASLTSAGAVQATLTIQASGNALTSSTKPTVTVKLIDANTEASYTASAQATLSVTHSSLAQGK